MKSIQFISYPAFIMIILVVLLGQSCKSHPVATDTSAYILPDSIAKILKYDTIKDCPLVRTISLSGKVSFNEDNVVKVYSVVSGNCENIRVMLGDYVHAGEMLGKIKSSEMAGFRNDLNNAKTNMQVAKENLDATQGMYKSGLASRKDIIIAQAAYAQAGSELNHARSVLSINGGNMNNDYIIRSPIDGFIVEKNITNDMAIRADDNTNLFTISDLKNVWIIANVYESNISQIHLNDSVRITTLAYPDKVFKGTINKIMNVLDPTNKVMKIIIKLPNPGYLLKPEMFANVVVINHEQQEALCVSSSTIVFDHSQNYVLVYHNNANIETVPVQVINTLGDKTYITGNLKPGDRLIASQTILIYQALNS
ncbi:efflux RND transporter periplasmic adaptor subunit [Microbacter margulisiae]|uniref:Cobalt-zinc-cadmium efflux system membrane fusion protein n=1 Tax=Microbacter margulisiae TaxID=1350067 RepID=A0A7W5DR65_9PORP|nr:efflux RND transporter periplasmic adaptor subunit [Microbacter margulisiae]MBB3186748.1 cobalt-zinc-cadmium efflux system membrane fusion protein [Microbacter margulisiae]